MPLPNLPKLPPHLDTGTGPTLYLTGERTLPGIEEETYWFSRHVAGYRLAAAAVPPGARLLDSGCGEGYGAASLADGGRAVFAVDVFADATRHARLKYPQAAYAVADVAALPFSSACFDAVVSLQVIEHLPSPGTYVAECARVLRPGGLLVLATPNRLTFTPPGRPKNPFHVVEFAADELEALLATTFREVAVTGLTDDVPGLADALIDAAFAGTPPPDWAAATVPAVTPANFRETSDLDSCLDLVARCRL